jgi:hypothetical protein
MSALQPTCPGRMMLASSASQGVKSAASFGEILRNG